MNLPVIKYERYLFAFFLLAGILFSSNAQKALLFKNLTTNDGLSHNTVYSIFEDKYGYIWMGTRNGLNRYDGTSFKVFRDQERGFKGNFINFIKEDLEGDLWVGTRDGGLNLYNWENDNFITCFPAKNRSDFNAAFNIEDILVIWPGTILIGTNGNGLYLYDKKTAEISSFNEFSARGKSENIIRIKCLQFGKDSIVWVGTLDGLYGLKLQDREIITLNDSILPELHSLQILSLLCEGESWLWAGTGTWRCSLNPWTKSPMSPSAPPTPWPSSDR